MVRSRAIIFALDEKWGLKVWDDMTFKAWLGIAIYRIQSKSTIYLLDSQIIFIYRWSIVIYRISIIVIYRRGLGSESSHLKSDSDIDGNTVQTNIVTLESETCGAAEQALTAPTGLGAKKPDQLTTCNTVESERVLFAQWSTMQKTTGNFTWKPKNIEPSICCAVELRCSLAIALICSGELDDLAGVKTEWKHLDPVCGFLII